MENESKNIIAESGFNESKQKVQLECVDWKWSESHATRWRNLTENLYNVRV